MVGCFQKTDRETLGHAVEALLHPLPTKPKDRHLLLHWVESIRISIVLVMLEKDSLFVVDHKILLVFVRASPGFGIGSAP